MSENPEDSAKLVAAVSEFFARTHEGEGEADVLIDIVHRAVLAERYGGTVGNWLDWKGRWDVFFPTPDHTVDLDFGADGLVFGQSPMFIRHGVRALGRGEPVKYRVMPPVHSSTSEDQP